MWKVITVQELAKRVIDFEDTLVLDIRNTDEFNNWKIEGVNVSVINEPYFNLLDGVDKLENRLNKNHEIIVVCAKGGTSEMITDMLREAGYSLAYSLEGGMKAWSEHLEPIKIGNLTGGGSLYQFVRLGKGCLSYFVESDGEAAIIDASRMTNIYTSFAKERGVKIKHILDTHLHADHISGGRILAEETGGTYYLSEKDAEEILFDYTNLEDHKFIRVGNTTVNVEAIYSPGHTIGSTSFIIDGTYLLTGDILFIRSIGRPDLAGLAEDWVSDLRQTLYSRYKNLSEELIVLPAHYSFKEELGYGGEVSAKLGDLYKVNSGLNVSDEDKFRTLVTKNLPPQPNAYQNIRETNMGKINPELEEQKEMEMGPNNCAVEA